MAPSAGFSGGAKLAAGAALALAALLAAWSWVGDGGGGHSAGHAEVNPAPALEPEPLPRTRAIPEPFPALPIVAAARTERAPEPEPSAAAAPEPAKPAQATLGRVRGVVRDPRGTPVAGARVIAERQGQADCDDRGEFALELPAGRSFTVHATAESLGPSDVRELSVESGQELEIELTLTVEAVLAGLVLDPGGRPEAKVRVNLGSLRGDPRINGQEASTGPDGRFEFRGLAAGTYLVVASEVADEREHAEGQALRIRQVTLAAGETTEVILGAAEQAELALSVRVTRAGEPFSTGQVILLPAGPHLLERAQSAVLDGEGRAEFRVRPGGYVVSVGRADWPGRPVTRAVEVGPLAPAPLEIALPAGGLSGRVLGPSGPLADCAVWIVREGHWDPLGLGQGPEAKTASDGAFAFEGLEAGRYSLRARGSRPIFDVELAPDGHCGGLVLRVEAAGSLRGRVLDPSGLPRSGASVHVRGPEGRWLAHWADASTRLESGEFAFDDLPPGEYTLLARWGELASAESEPVAVVAGEARDVELCLAPGARLRLALLESDGAPAASALFRAFDALGRSCDEPRSPHDLEILLAEGLAPHARVLGPLAPGTYRIEAYGPTGRRASAAGELAPGWNELTLRLP